jgi:hypothetical protein
MSTADPQTLTPNPSTPNSSIPILEELYRHLYLHHIRSAIPDPKQICGCDSVDDESGDDSDEESGDVVFLFRTRSGVPYCTHLRDGGER